ncbi:MAG: hypothetical protein P9L92_01680 [Candidatus Electryonea clarkiae]|nr:hypothetical protein [Candidatus Electryonea clarkiae]MDP8285379.1 hypothetical protein [Candidatus Electryonea clarkiae]
MSKKKRSALYHKAATLDEKFKEHLDLVWTLGKKNQQNILSELPSYLLSITDSEEAEAREQIIASLDGDPQDVIKAFHVLEALAKLWNPRNDTVDATLEDIQILHVLPEDEQIKNEAIAFLKEFYTILENDSDRRLRKSASAEILPYLVSCTTSIDFRLVLKDKFNWRTDSIEEYEPDIVGQIPIILVRIKLDEGEPKVFQCEAEELAMLIRKFQATLKELSQSTDNQSFKAEL